MPPGFGLPFPMCHWAGSATPVWTSTSTLGTRQLLAGCGTSKSNVLVFGGCDALGTTRYTNTELWNGSTWTTKTGLGQARYGLAGAGTPTSALSIAGETSSVVTTVESNNGTSWTNETFVGTAVGVLGGGGASKSAAIKFGGELPGNTAATDTYNGSAWSAGGALIAARRLLCGGGITTSAISIGGYTSSYVGNAETYNGSAWTSVTAASISGGGSACGVGNTSILLTNGQNATVNTNTAQGWNGSAWTSLANKINTLRNAGMGGISNSAIVACGYTTGVVGDTESYG